MKNHHLPIKRIAALLVILIIFILPKSITAQTLHINNLTDRQVTNAVLGVILSQRDYGKKIRSEVLHGANIELYDSRNGILYVTLPQSVKNPATILRKFSNSHTTANLNGRYLEINNRRMLRSAEKFYLFAVSRDSLKFDTEFELTFKFNEIEYKTNVEYIARGILNQYIHGGSLRIRRVPDGINRPSFMNHGALVTKKGHKNIENLVNQIISSSRNQSESIQKLLDFVTNEIKYDDREFYFGREFLQRHTETIASGSGDCSNKVILFASLLEQIDIDYRLVYTDNHIFVAVPKILFPTSNGYTYLFDDVEWTIAETTIPNFKIGITKIQNDQNIRNPNYYQNPRIINELRTANGNLILFN